MIKSLRDPVNGLTHCIGACLTIYGTVLLIVKSCHPVKPWHITTFAIFGVCMLLLYTASTLYHWLPLSEEGTMKLRKLDHMMIFMLIAGTYTPVCLIPLRGPWGWSMFGCIWGLALVGFFIKLFWMKAPRWLSTSIYVLMGWLVVACVAPLIKALQPGALGWLVTGGVFYTTGAIIYATKKPDPWPGVLGFHEIFHLFVMAGSFSHYLVMYNYIILFD